MKEKLIANELKPIFDTLFIEKAIYKAVYFDEISDFSQCDYSLIQQECEKLNFKVYKANNCPIDTLFLKKQWKNEKCLIIYNEETLKQINTNFQIGY